MFDTSDGGKHLPWITRKIKSIISGYNYRKYWNRYYLVSSPNSKTPSLLKFYYLIWLKKKDSKFCSSFGISYNTDIQYITPPYLPHGPNGIIVGSDAKLGEGVIIYHQVTIAGGGVEIGDHTELGAGAKILPHVRIGKYCHVGTNAVVVEDMPDYSTCVMQKPRIIQKEAANDKQ